MPPEKILEHQVCFLALSKASDLYKNAGNNMKNYLSLLCLTTMLLLSACAATTGAMRGENCSCQDASACAVNQCPNMKQDVAQKDCGDCTKDSCPSHKK